MKILETGNRYIIFESLKIQDQLDVKSYTLGFDEESGQLWLNNSSGYILPPVIYDDKKSNKLREMLKKSFKCSQKNLGVLLTGNKGQGKSLTIALTCKEISEEFNIPIIHIDKRIPKHVDFISFFRSIKQDFILVIDEFEKLFAFQTKSDDKFHDQNIFLSFMDGVTKSDNKILFLLATNGEVNEFLNNRPSRIKYKVDYDQMSEDLFDNIVTNRLLNQEFYENLKECVSLVNLNIDTLISIIDDINLFNMPFSEFKDLYNYGSQMVTYEVLKKVGNSDWKYMYSFRYEGKLKENTNYIGSYRVLKMIRFSQDEIVFLSNDEEDESDPTSNLKEKVYIKLSKIDNIARLGQSSFLDKKQFFKLNKAVVSNNQRLYFLIKINEKKNKKNKYLKVLTKIMKNLNTVKKILLITSFSEAQESTAENVNDN